MQHRLHLLFIDAAPLRYDLPITTLDYDIEEVSSIVQALSRFAGEVQPDIVLLAVAGQVDHAGRDLLCAMQTYRTEIPVVILLEDGSPEAALEALEYGAYDVIMLPCLPGLFSAQLNRAGTYARLASHKMHVESSQARLSAVQNMALVDELAQGLIHEIANPLSVIRINNSLLRTLYPSRDVETRLTAIDRAVARIQQSIEMLNAFSFKVDKADWVAIDDLTRDVVESLERDGRLVVSRVTTSFPPDLPVVWIRSTQIGQTVGSIVLNAEEAARDAGQEVCDIHIYARVEEHYLRLIIANNGPLIPAEDVERVFEPLYTTRRINGRVRGLGLGLFMARNVVEANGGCLELSSSPEEGVRVSILLPLDAQR